MTNTINTNELRRLRSMKSEMLLVDVLPKDKFDKDHIEGAQNAPLESPEFLATVGKAAGSKDKKIVVYCSGTGCDASAKAATKLTAAGYRDVTTYEGGITGWRQAPAETAPTLVGAGVAGAAKSASTEKPASAHWSNAPADKSASAGKSASTDKPAPADKTASTTWSNASSGKTIPSTKPAAPAPATPSAGSCGTGTPAPKPAHQAKK